MLIRRPAMSIFSSVYRFIECSKTSSYTLWPSVRRELWCAAMIAPLLDTNIRADWSTTVIATDASEIGSGVVYTSSSTVDTLNSQPSVPGTIVSTLLSSFVKQSSWKCAISHNWNDEEHINALEVRSVLNAVRWMIKKPSILDGTTMDHRRALVLCDSSASVGALNKGRSSSHMLLRPIRSVATLLLASGIYLTLKWIPTDLNPADGPSRFIH
jgi:hypothetical protein